MRRSQSRLGQAPLGGEDGYCSPAHLEPESQQQALHGVGGECDTQAAPRPPRPHGNGPGEGDKLGAPPPRRGGA